MFIIYSACTSAHTYMYMYMYIRGTDMIVQCWEVEYVMTLLTINKVKTVALLKVN